MPNKQTLAAAAEIRQEVRRLRISAEDAGRRLDNFVASELKGVPRGHLYRLLRTGQVRVNGGRRGADYRLVAGDELRLPPVRIAERTQSVGPLKRVSAVLVAGILYEDAALLVVAKPSGLPVHGGSGLDGGLIEALRTLRAEPGLELVHRLDRDTSGCILIARRKSALRTLHAAFRTGDVEKQYLALLVGRIEREFVSSAPLRRYVKRGGERHVAVADDGRAAVTHFRPLAPGADTTLVVVEPDTGRTHQIRVHAAHAGHPVAGDPRYGDKTANRALKAAGLTRLALHAARISFSHPQTGVRHVVEAPLPADLERIIGRLTNGGTRN
ncbi:MAG: RluA family pseudouridine synthase [Gammaproteobacteria bacterium]